MLNLQATWWLPIDTMQPCQQRGAIEAIYPTDSKLSFQSLRLTYACAGLLHRNYTTAWCPVKERARSGCSSPCCVQSEAGEHGRRTAGRPLEASNGTLNAPALPPRALSFT